MSSSESVTKPQSVPRHIPTDTIIPLHRQDDTLQNRNLSIEFTMRFDDVLDAQQLADSLCKLLEKLGYGVKQHAYGLDTSFEVEAGNAGLGGGVAERTEKVEADAVTCAVQPSDRVEFLDEGESGGVVVRGAGRLDERLGVELLVILAR